MISLMHSSLRFLCVLAALREMVFFPQSRKGRKGRKIEIKNFYRVIRVKFRLHHLIVKKIISRNYLQSFHIRFEFIEIALIVGDDKTIVRPSRSRNQSVVLLLLSRCYFPNVSFGYRLLAAK